MEVIEAFKCTRCEHQTRAFRDMIRHYQAVHSTEAGFRVICGIDGCYRNYCDVMYLCRHIRQKHADFYKKHMQASKIVGVGDIDDIDVIDDDAGETSFACPPSEQTENEDPPCKMARKSSDQMAFDYVASMSLKLREFNKVHSCVGQEVRQNIAFMLASSRQMLLHDLSTRLTELNASSAVKNAVSSILSTPLPFETACETLQNDRHVNSYVENTFGYVKPIQYCLQDDKVDKKEYMQYVPILESIRMLLQNDDIFSSIINNHQSSDGKLRDVCDGSYFRGHALFGFDPHAIQIILYYDDFCPVNPLGHRAKKYKVAGFYFMIGNIEPKHRSQLHTVHLVTLCFSSSLKRFGFQKVLQPLINDLVTLNKCGISVQRPDGNFVLKGSVLLVVADNLAAHGLGGFLESFTSEHPCRFCLISKSGMQTNLRCDASCLRTQENYTSQVERVSKHKALRKVYGLKHNSCLNEIPKFNVTSAIPSDVMHDLLEGVVCDVVELVVKYLVMSDFCTLEHLNEQIEKFPYQGTDKVNKPDALSLTVAAFKFAQTAAKGRCFLRLMPLMIGNRIPVNDSKWEVLLLLLDVHDIAMSPVMSVNDTHLLDDAVCDFLHRFSCEFPDVNIKPKMHYLTHYGAHCRMFGPMVNYWSFRFESKHSYFKEISSRMKCRRNVLKTFARKHQYLHTWHLQRSGSYLYRDQNCNTGGRLVAVDSLSECIQTAVKPVAGDVDMLFKVNTVTVDGVAYALDMAVVTGICDAVIHVSRICAIFIVDSVPVFVCCALTDQAYHRHYHLYSFKDSHTYHHIRIKDLADPFPLCIYECASMNSELCVVLKHSLSCGH